MTMREVLTSLAMQGSATAAAYPSLIKLAHICLVFPVGTADWMKLAYETRLQM